MSAGEGPREAALSLGSPGDLPSACYWWEDPAGDLCLIPGCAGRASDPDAECTCETLARRLDAAHERARDQRRQQEHADAWWRALRAAVEAHPDRDAILAEARRLRADSL